MTFGFSVEASLLNVLQHDVVAVVVRIDYFVALATILQGSEVVQLTAISNGLNSGPPHDLLFPGGIEAGGIAVVVVKPVVHDVP